MQGVIEVSAHRLDSLKTDGMELPYIEFGEMEPAIKLMAAGEEFWYYKTFPLKGYGGAMAPHIRGLLKEGKKPLLARFGTRIYVYATGIKPIGAGKAPGA